MPAKRGPRSPRIPGRRWLFDQAEDAQLICDREGLIQRANHRAVQWFGWILSKVKAGQYRLSDILNSTTCLQIGNWLTRPEGFQEILPGESIVKGLPPHLLADLQVTIFAPGLAWIVIKDASRRSRLESHVHRLMTAVDSTSDIIFLTDEHLRLVFVNAAFQSVTGFNIEDSLGRTSDFLRHPAEKDKVAECLERIHRGQDWKGELRNIRADGREYLVEATISPVFDKQGLFMGYASFERDISLRKQLENEVRIERNHLLSIINSLDTAVYSLDINFRLCHVNDGWKKLPPQHGWLNLSTAPEVDRSLLDYVEDPARRLELQGLLDKVLREGQSQEIQASGPGPRRWTIRIAPWMDDNEICGLIYVVTDITQFHDLQRQLYQAQKMETVGALAAGVAHDFNNLLQVVRGNVNLLLLMDCFDETTQHHLRQIDQAAGRATDLTQQLLSFSRASEEQITVLDWNQVVEEAGTLIRKSLLSKIDLRICPSDQPIRIRMDATRAQQLLLNLCVNAQDSMPNGGTLTLSNRLIQLSGEQSAKTRFPAGASFAECLVIDTGSGISPAVMSRIFDPFFTTKEKGKGTGLGLAIVQSIIAQAGGFVEVESTVEVGTTFHLFLPTVQATLTVEKKEKAHTQLRKGSGRILVVDDLDMVLDFTRTFLQYAGYQVFAATSAEQALETLDHLELPVDLVFTDHNMPGMNGRQLIEAVSRRWPTCKFIIASGYLDDQERQELEKIDGVRLLNKPFNMREAADIIAEVLVLNATPG